MFHARSGGSDSSSSGESSDSAGKPDMLGQVPQSGSRRGGKRGGKKGNASLGDFVEEMNSSFGKTIDSCEQTVDSRDITSPKLKGGDPPGAAPVRQPNRRAGRRPIKEEDDEEEEE
jgi:hypothetical protein